MLVVATPLLATPASLGCRTTPTQAHAPVVPPSAVPDVQEISRGTHVELSEHLVAGKVTVFDFHAQWCKPCKEVDRHLAQVLATRGDVAVRKIDVVDWDSEVAKTHLRYAPTLPYVVVFGVGGKEVAKISGLKLDALDQAIERGSRK